MIPEQPREREFPPTKEDFAAAVIDGLKKPTIYTKA